MKTIIKLLESGTQKTYVTYYQKLLNETDGVPESIRIPESLSRSREITIGDCLLSGWNSPLTDKNRLGRILHFVNWAVYIIWYTITYICIERERKREREIHIHIHTYIHIYIYIYMRTLRFYHSTFEPVPESRSIRFRARDLRQKLLNACTVYRYSQSWHNLSAAKLVMFVSLIP